MIRKVDERLMRRVYKQFKLREGLPKLETNPEVLRLLQEAQYDKEAIGLAKKKLKETQKAFKKLRQEVNAGLAVAQDSLTATAALEMAKRAMLLIQRSARSEVNEQCYLLAYVASGWLVWVQSVLMSLLLVLD